MAQYETKAILTAIANYAASKSYKDMYEFVDSMATTEGVKLMPYAEAAKKFGNDEGKEED